MTSIAFFDVDKTLLKGYSGFYTTLLLIQKGILKKRRLPLSLFYLLISPFYKGNVQRMYETAARDMAGRSIEDVLDIGRECFKKWIQPRLYREGIAAVQKHQERGDPVYLMTSGPYMTIRILADYLGVNGDYSSGPVIEKGILTDKIRMPVCYREGKVFAASDVVK
ncbi:MAG: haloacid dehalogenase-like hydrolase, partial [Deltaproteobacteria bacterium]|nr:haloacid dehalogenase-like hydrolase [Deltaproteobacteria bacterium]